MNEKWTYHWLHIPSGKTGIETVLVSDLVEKYKSLNHALANWNRLGTTVWKYWADTCTL